MPMAYDLLVIGAGAAGGSAAHTAASMGARVVQIERDKIGGTCLNYGCDPTKTLLHIAQELYRTRHSTQLGLSFSSFSVEWPRVLAYVQEVITDMRGGNMQQASEQLHREGIEFIAGDARLLSPHEVEVNGRHITTERVILAVGCQPEVPAIEGLHEAGFITNIQAVSLSTLPRRLAIIGGGAIGIEFAQMFQRFGVQVTVLEKHPQILATEDQELADLLRTLLTHEGIELISDAELQRVEKTSEGKQLTYRSAQGPEQKVVVDEILLALGRRPALEKLGLETIGVKTTQKGIEVDPALRTSVPHIWAAGDIVTKFQFTHVANEQGALAARNAFATHPTPFDRRAIPWVTFTDPPLAHVGQTEEELREQQKTYTVRRLEFKEIERALTMGQTEGKMKFLVDEKGLLLGAHILGPRADELLTPLILTIQNELPVARLAATLLPYPTLSEGLRTLASRFS
ncbi:MAG TPA: FAD-dependent oxidoreductase [Ktedonobacteraceae bacterium]|nr:FAD-dependent oxidoreductase [Ktedonobacteraceae bacterium]